MKIPSELAGSVRDGDGPDPAWIDALDATVERLARAWELVVGAPFEPGGRTAWVAPARTHAGDDVVLKVGWVHAEAEHEADGLRVWDGAGAVRLLDVARVGDTNALLLERCTPGTTLRPLPEPDQDVIIASLVRRLWLEPPPSHPFRPLRTMCDEWADAFERRLDAIGVAATGLDDALVREGVELFRSLPAGVPHGVLLVTDLHAGNVLAAEREPWLAVDPKPYVGDPAYDVVQHMLNCDERLRDDPHGLAHRMAALTGLDGSRVVRWLFARCVLESWRSPLFSGAARALAP